MKTDSKRTLSVWVYPPYSIVLWLFVASRVVRDVQEKGLESALRFWGLLFVCAAVLGLVIHVIAASIRRRSRRAETAGDRLKSQ